jgi:hypothetical protein
MKVTLIGIDLATKTTKKTAMIAPGIYSSHSPYNFIVSVCDVALVLR